MTIISRAKAALRRGGAGELVRAGRRALARAIYPGPLPRAGKSPAKTAARPAPPAKAVHAAPPAPKPSAVEVSLEQALAFFEPRRAIYDKLMASIADRVDATKPIYDIGANMGYFTRVFGETLGLTGDAHLFEPLPNLAKVCGEYLADVPYPVHVHNFGLSDADATVEFFVDRGNLGWNTMVAEQAKDDMVRVQVEVRRFDTAGIDAEPGFIKIDVEGAEYRVLQGLLPALSRWDNKPVILCEVGWGTSGHPAWDEEIATFKQVEALGYRAADLDGNPVEIATISKTSDVLLLPTD